MTVPQEISLDDAMKIATRNMHVGNYRVAELALTDIVASVPDHFEAHFLLGMAHYHMGNAPQSLINLKIACDSPDATAEWLSNYGVICNELGRRQEALSAFDKGIKLEPKNGRVYWNKCYTLWLAERYKEAEAAGLKAVKLDPKSPEAWLNLGACYARMDRLDEAMECWRATLKLRPDFAFAWNNMGNALREKGKLKESEQKCLKALEIDPNYVEALNNLANVYLDQGKYELAENWYRRAIANKPDYAEAHNNLCVALMCQSRFEEAITHGRYAVTFRENYVDAYLNLSEAMRNLGHVDEARKAIEKAVILRPDSAAVRMDLADVLFMQDKYADAEVELNKVEKLKPENPRIFIKLAGVQEKAGKLDLALATINKAIKMSPEMFEAYFKRGQIYHVANKVKEAERDFLKALKLVPNNASTFISLADLYLTTGRLKEAKTYAEKARKIMPNAPGVYNTLAQMKSFTKNDPDFKKMLEIEKGGRAMGLEQTSTLNFALFKAYQDTGEYRKAFACLKKASDCKRRLVPYESERHKAYFETLKNLYTPKFLKSLEGKGYNSHLPVFIVGMPRSGTTLTEQIISAHPDVYGAGELLELSHTEQHFGGVTKENCRDMGAHYVRAIKKLDPSGKAKRITDKLPGNYAGIGLIASILPQAKIIHCRRDPIDTCLSCYKQNFARGQYWSYNLEELAFAYGLYEDMMAYWREVLPGRFIEIDYEDTVNDIETQARRLIEYLDLPWNKACLLPHKHKRTVLTASKMQVIKPVYKSSIKSWKRYEKELQPLIKGLKAGKTSPAKKASQKKIATKKTAAKTLPPNKTVRKPARRKDAPAHKKSAKR